MVLPLGTVRPRQRNVLTSHSIKTTSHHAHRQRRATTRPRNLPYSRVAQVVVAIRPGAVSKLHKCSANQNPIYGDTKLFIVRRQHRQALAEWQNKGNKGGPQRRRSQRAFVVNVARDSTNALQLLFRSNSICFQRALFVTETKGAWGNRSRHRHQTRKIRQCRSKDNAHCLAMSPRSRFVTYFLSIAHNLAQPLPVVFRS